MPVLPAPLGPTETHAIEAEARRKIELAADEFVGSMTRISRGLERRGLDTLSAYYEAGNAATVLEQQLRRYLACDSPMGRQLGKRLREQTGPWFMRSQFHARAYTKPQGYAGDYLTIELLYAAVPHGEGIIGRTLDAWALERPAAYAVRNRRVIVADAIHRLVGVWPQSTVVAITSLGSGPARELVDVLSAGPTTGLHATCVDIDPDALTYARALACEAGVLDNCSFVRANVVQLARSNRSLSSKQHLIYSIGLFDYLPDRVALAVLNWTHGQLHSEGTLLIGNVDAANPSRAYMDHLLDWRLIHRSANQLRQLVARSHFGEQAVRVTRDATGVQLFAACKRG